MTSNVPVVGERRQKIIRYFTSVGNFQLLLTIAFTLLQIIVTWQTFVYSRANATDDLIESSTRKLTLFTTSLTNELDKHGILPQVLAEDERIMRLLLKPDDLGWQRQVNEYLEHINNIARTSDAYVLDKQGTTIAASNWQKDDTFLRLNFSFRPYFQQAIQGKLAHYAALGSASNKRGYYYAHPIRIKGLIMGVAVVKISPDKLEEDWLDEADRLFVTDENGVIFISNHPELRFFTLNKLDPQLKQMVLDSRQYANKPLEALPLIRSDSGDGSSVFMQVDHKDDPLFSPARRFLYESRSISNYDWQAHILTDSRDIYEQVFVYVISSGAVVTIIFLVLSYLLQRYRNNLLEIQHQKAIEKTILETNKTLELKVVERTVKLVETNRQLSQRILQHQEAERKLIQAKDQLLQSSKLAVVGQMSAGLAHELSQPLTAIKNYLYTAQMMISADKYDDLEKRITDIMGLTERMVKLTRQLRSFSRKSTHDIKTVALMECLQSSVSLIMQAHRQQIEVSYDIDDDNIRIRTDPVQFEQVLINLLKNAVDATADSALCRISISATLLNDMVALSIRDYGTGIPEDALDSLFDAFFTTKGSDTGLGLGLSISQGIMNNLGGSIVARNHPEGGAMFVVTVPRESSPSSVTLAS